MPMKRLVFVFIALLLSLSGVALPPAEAVTSGSVHTFRQSPTMCWNRTVAENNGHSRHADAITRATRNGHTCFARVRAWYVCPTTGQHLATPWTNWVADTTATSGRVITGLSNASIPGNCEMTHSEATFRAHSWALGWIWNDWVVCPVASGSCTHSVGSSYPA